MFMEVELDRIKYPIFGYLVKYEDYVEKENVLEEIFAFYTNIDNKKLLFKAKYTPELYRDLCGVYGLDPSEELFRILEDEFISELKEYLKGN